MPHYIRSAWFKTLGQLVAALAVAVLLGWLLGHVWLVLTVAALGVVAWHYWRLRKVLLRLTARQRIQTVHGDGVWNELDRLLYRGQSEMRTRKRHLLDLLRAYRAAADALPDAVVVVERNSQRVQWFNKAATTLLGLQRSSLGASLGDRLQPLPLSHWLAAGRNAEPMLDAASPVDPELRLNLRLIPYSDEYWLLVADARGDAAAAGKHFQAAAKSAPGSGVYANNYGRWLCANARAADSLEWFDRALTDQAYPTPVRALANAGECAHKAGQPARAEASWRAALAIDAADLQALAGMAALEFGQGKHFEARAFVERWLAVAPDDPAALQLATQVEEKAGDNVAASRYRSRLEAISPGLHTAPRAQ